MNHRRNLQLVLLGYTCCYVVFAGSVLFAEPQVYALLDFLQGIIGIGKPSGAPPPTALWKYVALGLILVLAASSWWAYRDVDRGRPLLHLMVYAKFFSGGLMVAHFAVAGGQTAFLLGGLSDVAMGVGVLVPLMMVFPRTASELLKFQIPV